MLTKHLSCDYLTVDGLKAAWYSLKEDRNITLPPHPGLKKRKRTVIPSTGHGRGTGAALCYCLKYDIAQPPGEHLGKSIKNVQVSNPTIQLRGLHTVSSFNVFY